MKERLALAFAVLLAPAPAASQATAFGDPLRGQSLFVSKGCVACHAVRGAGGRIGPDLGRTAVKGSFFEIAAAMWNHALAMDDKMREFRVTRPAFEGGELKDVVSFLYFLNYFDEPGDAKTGKVLFAEKHCIQCHRVGRAGGRAGPRLDRIPRGSPPLRIAQDLWNHGPAMVSSMRQIGLDVPEFQGTEILDLFAYLRNQGQPGGARAFRTAGEPQRGRRLFVSKGCGACHAVFGKGGGIGPDLGRAELRGSVTQLAGSMWNHWSAMSQAMAELGMAPPTFQGDELADMFAYLFQSRYDGPPVERGSGATVYREKGCAGCHGERREGAIGPALVGLAGEAKERVFERMWNHAPQMGKTMSARQIPWPRLEAEALAALLEFLAQGRSTSPASRLGHLESPGRRQHAARTLLQWQSRR